MWDNDYEIYCPWDEPKKKEKKEFSSELKVDLMKLEMLMEKIPDSSLNEIDFVV